ncbi:MAG: S9 family peptidase, partial [Myxococcales bacterium]|nr:S9 family peptidase [Myxococcales bacterium]
MTRTAFDDTCVDDYAWLRDKEDPAVRAHMQAEREHAEAVITACTHDLRGRLYAEMRGRIKEDERSLPVKDGPWLYYTLTEIGDEYPRHCRRPWQPGHEGLELDAIEALDPSGEQLYLDENQLAEDHEYFDLSVLAVSTDHRLCAYAIDTTGDEVYEVHVRDLDGGVILDDRLEGCADELVWGDDRWLFYMRLDERHRPWQLWRHHLGHDPAEDVLVFQEDDDRFFLSIHRSRSDAFLVLSSASHTSGEQWLIPTADPCAAPVLVAAREADVEYQVEHRGEHLYIVDNRGARNFQLWRAPVHGGDRSDWELLIPHR